MFMTMDVSQTIANFDENGDRIIIARRRDDIPGILDHTRCGINGPNLNRPQNAVHVIQASDDYPSHSNIRLSSPTEVLTSVQTNVLTNVQTYIQPEALVPVVDDVPCIIPYTAVSVIDGIESSTISDAHATSSSTSNSDSTPICNDGSVMNISWKDIVKEYVKRYDEVFCLTSAKAHLDICDLVVDGAKDKWRYIVLLDTLVCFAGNRQKGKQECERRRFDQYSAIRESVAAACALAIAKGKEIGGEKDKVTNGENAEQTVESVALGSPTQIPEDEKKVSEEKDEKEKEVGSEGVMTNVMVKDILLMAAKKEEEKVLKNEIEQTNKEGSVPENENKNSQSVPTPNSPLLITETVVEVTQELTDLEEIRKNEKMPKNCRVVEIESPWTDTEELRKYMIENCITSKSWKRRQKCVNLLCNDDALVQKGSLGKILVDICTNIYSQHFSGQLPISLTRINHPGARQPILPSLRGAPKYVGPFSGAGVVPKNANKPKSAKALLAEKNQNSPGTVKSWMDGENSFSTLATGNVDGCYYVDGDLQYGQYVTVTSDGLSHKKDHNRIRKEKREKKAMELALIESQKVQFKMNDFEIDGGGERSRDDDSDYQGESSSSSLKNLLYRAHNGSDNRTDPVDMKNNHGKLDERSYGHNPYDKSYAYESGVGRNREGRAHSSGRYDENNGNGNNSNTGNGNGNNNGNGKYSSSSSSSSGISGPGSGTGPHGEELVELASLLTHIRKPSAGEKVPFSFPSKATFRNEFDGTEMRNNNENSNNRKRAGDDVHRDDVKVKKQTVRKSKTVKGANTDTNGNQSAVEKTGNRNHGYQDMRGEEMDIEHVRDGDATLYRVDNNGNYEIITDTWNSTKKTKKQSVPKIPKIPKVKKGKDSNSNLTSSSTSSSTSNSNVSAVGGAGSSNEINAMDALFWALEQQEKMKISQLEKEKRENEMHENKRGKVIEDENENEQENEKKRSRKNENDGKSNGDENGGTNTAHENNANQSRFIAENNNEERASGSKGENTNTNESNTDNASGIQNSDVKTVGDNDTTILPPFSSSSSSMIETI